MRGVRGRATVATASFTAVLLGAVLAPEGSPARALADDRYSIKTTEVRPGVRLSRIVDRHGPNRIRVLRVDLAQQVTIDVALANEELPGHERPSSMAARHHAVAAINGDYTVRPFNRGAGRPVDLFAEDTELHASSLIWGRNLGITRSEKRVYIGHPKEKAALFDKSGGRSWTIDSWNEWRPSRGELAAYTPEGGAAFRAPRNACALRLYPSSPVTWRKERRGVQRSYVVKDAACSRRAMSTHRGIVVATPRGTKTAKKLMRSVRVRETVTIGWSTGWAGVVETIGGNPSLLENEKVTIGGCYDSYFCGRNPRTGVGVTPDGGILLVTVDGRRPGYSVGMTLYEFKDLFRFLGATSALNLDGGGSTVMVVEGRIVNNPSDGSERPVGSAILVLPGPDPDEPAPAPRPKPGGGPLPLPPLPTPPGPENVVPAPQLDIEPPSPPEPVAPPACLSLRDPGSTGGLLDALDRGELGSARGLPAPLERALAVYRAGRSCSRAASSPPS